MLYIWQGWSLATTGAPLHDLNWEAWQYGPVQPAVYYNLNHLRGQTIKGPILSSPDAEFTKAETHALEAVFRRYRQLGPSGLSRLTRAPGSPWEKVWRRRRGSMVIPNQLLREHFMKLVDATADHLPDPGRQCDNMYIPDRIATKLPTRQRNPA